MVIQNENHSRDEIQAPILSIHTERPQQQRSSIESMKKDTEKKKMTQGKKKMGAEEETKTRSPARTKDDVYYSHSYG